MPGGKQKQANRTKGNVRPSSSGRAAEILASGGGTITGFQGFDTMSDLGYVPAAFSTEEADSTVDADFRMVLRKFSKRDTTTKIKTIQEFETLCKEKTAEDIIGVLPFWPRLYNKLCIDNDRRVREATGQAFEQLVLRVRRNLAPHLKGLMGGWLLAQCDVHPPAALAAKAAFQAAFPPAKQTEAVMFCKSEVLQYLKDNLLQQTPQTLSDPKNTAKEDMESKYVKVISSSLLALRMFLMTIPKDQQQELITPVGDILASPKLWKHSKNQNNVVRSAYYSMISSVCHVYPDLAAQYSDKICPLVMHHLNESDPIVCPPLWEAVLYVITKIDDCWKHINHRKALFPHLWSLMKAGFHGSANVICPSLLPLLSKLPDDVIGQGSGFYNEFFGNMKSSLCVARIIQSPSDCASVVRAYMECIRYCLVKGMEKEEGLKLQEFFILDQMMPLIESSHFEAKSPLPSSPLYAQLSAFLVFFHKLHVTSDSELKRDQAGKILKIFWDSFSSVCLQCVENSQDSSSPPFVLDRMALMFQNLRHPKKQQKKQSGRVLFSLPKNPKSRSGEKAAPSQSSKYNTGDKESYEVSQDISYLLAEEGPCLTLVSKLCKSTFQIARPKKSHPHIQFFSRVLSTYKIKRIFSEVLSDYGEGVQEGVCVTFTFVQDIVVPWMREFEDEECSEEEDALPGLVELLFAVFEVADEDTKKQILSHVCQEISSAKVMYHFMTKLLSLKRDSVIQQWLKGKEFGEKLVTFTKNLCEESLHVDMEEAEDLTSSWSLLSLALSTEEDFEPVIASQYVNEILTVLHQALPSMEKGSQLSGPELEKIVSFICELAHNFFSNFKGCLMMLPAEELLFTLFQLCLRESLPLTESELEKIQYTWQAGVLALVQQKGGYFNPEGFFYKATAFLKFLVLNGSTTMSRLDHLVTIAFKLLMTVADGLNSDDYLNNETVKMFIQQLKVEGSMALITGVWKESTLMTGKLLFTTLPTDGALTSYDTIPPAVASVLFYSQLISKMNEKQKELAAEEGESEKVVDLFDAETAVELSYACVYCKAALGCKAEPLKLTEFGQASQKLRPLFDELFPLLSKDEKEKLVKTAVDRSLEEGGLSSLCLEQVLTHRLSDDALALIGSIDRFSELSLPLVHTLACILPHASRSDVPVLLEILGAKIITCPMESITDISGGLGSLRCFNNVLGEVLPWMDGEQTITPEVILEVMSKVSQWKEELEIFCFSSDIQDYTWDHLVVNIEVMKLMKMAIEKIPTRLDEKCWDFIQCSLVSWIQSCSMSADELPKSLAAQAFSAAAFGLLETAVMCIMTVAPENDTMPANLTTEWTEFFSEGIYSALFPLFIQVIGAIKLSELTFGQEYLLANMGHALSFIPEALLENHTLPAKLVADDVTNLEDKDQTLLNHLCPLLLSPSRIVQLTAYKLLIKVMGKFPAADSDQPVDGEDDKNETARSPPQAVMKVLQTSTEAVQIILDEVKCGECMEIEPYIDEYILSTAYLLSWKLLLKFFSGAKSELRAQYATHLKKTGAIHSLLVNVFSLMPESPVIQLKDALTSQSPMSKLSPSKNLFSEEPLLLIRGVSTSRELKHVACCVYYTALQELPALVRQWVNERDKKTASVVDRFTTKYVSPVLITQEMQSLLAKERKFNNMIVKARPAARDILATYCVEEATMELMVQLPANHPLGTISVEAGKRVGVANTQWRNWMLQMTTYLNHQRVANDLKRGAIVNVLLQTGPDSPNQLLGPNKNGSIIEGLKLWKKNVDKRFEGVEDCMICFSVIHGSNYQLPKLQCKTCKKKYHADCLYKWFNTSNNSTCPLCRNLF